MDYFLRLIAVVFVTSFFSGCTSLDDAKAEARAEAPEPIVISDQYKPFNIDAYGLLKETKSGYRFTEFSLNPTRGDGWVNLRTAMPTWDMKADHCRTEGLIDDWTGSSCNEERDKLRFIDRQLHKEDFAKRVVGTPILMGIPFLMMGNGYFLVFDAELYTESYIEAVKNLDTSLIENIEKNYLEISAKQQVITELYAKRKKQIEDDQPFKVIDKSGFFNRLRDLDDVIDVSSKYGESLSLKASSLEELNTYLEYSARDDLNKMSASIDRVDIYCNTSKKVDGFDIRYDCPDELIYKNNKLTNPPTVIVESRSVSRLLPKGFVVADGNLTISLSNERIVIANHSDKYISISEVSLYLGNQVHTLEGANLTAAPSTTLASIPLYRFSRDYGFSDNSLTLSEAKIKTYNFGLAANYAISGEAAAKSVYKQKAFRVIDLL